MKEITDKISMLMNCNNLPHYAKNLFKGIGRAINEGREIEIGGNSLLFVRRMFDNRFG